MIWTASFTKMKFLVQKAIFIAHGITTDGLQPNPVTVQVTVSMPTPTDKQVVHRFLEAINFLSKFCPQLNRITLAASMEPDQRGDTILAANTTPRSIYWSKNPCLLHLMPGRLRRQSLGGPSSRHLWLWSRSSSYSQAKTTVTGVLTNSPYNSSNTAPKV